MAYIVKRQLLRAVAAGSSEHLSVRQSQPQTPEPSEIPTNIGILTTAGVLFVLILALCFLDHRKRARVTDAGKQGYTSM